MFRTARILILFVILATVAAASASMQEFRIDQDRLWLRAETESLTHLLELFAAAGVQVQIDPAVQKTVNGDWLMRMWKKLSINSFPPTTTCSIGAGRPARSAKGSSSPGSVFFAKDSPTRPGRCSRCAA